jgi:hypothetical protein
MTIRILRGLGGALVLTAGMFSTGALAEDDFRIKIFSAEDISVLSHGGPMLRVVDAHDLAVGEKSDDGTPDTDYVATLAGADDIEVLPGGGPALRILDAQDLAFGERSGPPMETRARAAERTEIRGDLRGSDLDADFDDLDDDDDLSDVDVDVDVDGYGDTDVRVRKLW